jgi:thiamine-phosphate diphosphorylase/hydroxyethylthiazole kinase
MTGVHDYITDGRTVLKLSNGHPLLGDITGSGCMVGTAVATFCGAHNISCQPAHSGRLYACNALYAAAVGVSAVNIAAELAAEKAHVNGPGSFLPALIDELALLTPEIIMERLKVEVLTEAS